MPWCRVLSLPAILPDHLHHTHSSHCGRLGPPSTNGLHKEAVSRLRQQIASTTTLRLHFDAICGGIASGHNQTDPRVCSDGKPMRGAVMAGYGQNITFAGVTTISSVSL